MLIYWSKRWLLCLEGSFYTLQGVLLFLSLKITLCKPAKSLQFVPTISCVDECIRCVLIVTATDACVMLTIDWQSVWKVVIFVNNLAQIQVYVNDHLLTNDCYVSSDITFTWLVHDNWVINVTGDGTCILAFAHVTATLDASVKSDALKICFQQIIIFNQLR